MLSKLNRAQARRLTCFVPTKQLGECVVTVDPDVTHIQEGPNLIHRVKVVFHTAEQGVIPDRHYVVSWCGTQGCLAHTMTVELSDMSEALVKAGLHGNARKTHCVKHQEPYHKTERQRVCRSCQAEHSRAYRARKKAKEEGGNEEAA